MLRGSETTAAELHLGVHNSALDGKVISHRYDTCYKAHSQTARLGQGVRSLAALWALAATAWFLSAATASAAVCSVTSVTELVQALTNVQCSILQIEGAGLALRQSEWAEATQGISEHSLVVSRDFTLRGSSRRTVLDCGYLKARIVTTAYVTVHVTELFLPNCRQPSSPLASGLDILSLGMGAELVVSNSTFEYALCAPLAMMAEVASETDRPPDLSGIQSVWPASDYCLEGLPRGPNCWDESLSYGNFALDGTILGPGGDRISRGTVLYQDCTLVCSNAVTEECVAVTGLPACTNALVTGLDLTEWDTHDLPDAWPGPDTEAEAAELPAGEAPADSMRTGKLLAIVVPSVCAGLGLVLAIVGLAVWTQRRKTFSPSPAAVKEAYEGVVFVGLSHGSEEQGPSTSMEDGVAAVVVGAQSKGKHVAPRLHDGNELLVDGIWNEAHRYPPSWDGQDGQVRGSASLTVSNCTSSSAPAIVGIIVTGAGHGNAHPPASTSSRDGMAVCPLLDSDSALPFTPLNLVLGVDVIVSSQPVTGRSSWVLLGQYGQQPVAIKVFHRDHLGGSFQELHALKQDIDALARCQHPNVVPLLGAGEAPGGDEVFVLEDLVGTSLSRVCHEGSGMSLDRVLSVALDVALGLSYLHPTVTHRSVKPTSVLLDAGGSAKLADYGLGRLLANGTDSGSDFENGVSRYMAPECFRGKTRPATSGKFPITPQSDIYSFGVLLWELLARERPWRNLNPMQVALAVGYQNRRLEIPTTDRFPPKVRKLILQCWEQDPRKRPSAADLAKRLSHLIQQQRTRR